MDGLVGVQVEVWGWDRKDVEMMAMEMDNRWEDD
jgi:hypothetical protein